MLQDRVFVPIEKTTLTEQRQIIVLFQIEVTHDQRKDESHQRFL